MATFSVRSGKLRYISNLTMISSRINCATASYIHNRSMKVISHNFSTTSKNLCKHMNKDRPYAFSKSQARHHTVDESLGISKPKTSYFPIYLGLGLFSVFIYVCFLRQEPEESVQTLEGVMEKIKKLHEENQQKELLSDKAENESGHKR